ncbi:236_t:CDS:2, partial [Racocetra persica]
IKIEMSLVKFTSQTSSEFPEEGELEWLGLEKTEQLFFQKVKTSLKEMFEGFNEALKTGRPDIQPLNTLVSNNLEAIYRCLTPARLEIFTCLIEKKPHNLRELSQLLKRDYAN